MHCLVGRSAGTHVFTGGGVLRCSYAVLLWENGCIGLLLLSLAVLCCCLIPFGRRVLVEKHHAMPHCIASDHFTACRMTVSSHAFKSKDAQQKVPHPRSAASFISTSICPVNVQCSRVRTHFPECHSDNLPHTTSRTCTCVPNMCCL